MSDKDWTDLGNDIRDMVDDAVKSQDFRKLNENICRTVTDGLDNISRSIKKNEKISDQTHKFSLMTFRVICCIN